MAKILVVANETIGGAKLLETVRSRAKGDAEFYLVVPRTRPRKGTVIYDDAVHDAAQVRVDLATQFLAPEGIEVHGEVGDEDAFTATMDAIAEFDPDEVIISTYPTTSSGWLRRDLPERVENESDLPVTHVVVDMDAAGLPFAVTLVIASKTARGAELLDNLKAKAQSGDHLFIVVQPMPGGRGNDVIEARQQLAATLRAYRDADIVCAGLIGDPDPYVATMNALQSFRVSEVVLSTLPEQKSGWMREHLVERIQSETAATVEHVVSDPQGAAV